ncbi:MAG TPA: VOC family protein [Candidatus Limnocylindrales bacterium]|nr:VOC family protein [Candidatus Limnocylindrales bacterium]
MPQLRQLVIAAADPGRLAGFYQEVFELDKIDEGRGAVFLSDGIFNLALLSEAAPAKRGMRHLSFDTTRAESLRIKLANLDMADSELHEVNYVAGSDHELCDPDGNLVGISRRAFDVAFEHRPVPIRHIALYTPNPQRLRDFYCTLLDMKEVERTDRSSIFVSDGYINLALLYQRTEEPKGLNHFGFHVKSNDEMQSRAEKAGMRRGAKRPDRIPFAEYRVHDPEGNGIDISEKGWRI